ncbi:collagen-like protein [Streptomyces decoyicus]|uniref:collagen-like protein n=1 Tax=Streptomyces decoyicus TaxID=249567 RepID=UPI002E17E606
MMRPQVRAEERRWRRGDALTVAGALLLGAVIAWIVLAVQQVSGELQDANQARDALARQVQQLGGRPVAGPPGSRGDPGPAVRGPRGYRGKDGKDGTDATGKPGSPGKNGATGKAGADGQNSTVPGPSGAPGQPGQNATGAPGQPGRDGKDGKDGVDGQNGRDGADGQTCPDGYSLQPAKDDPDALVCRRDGAPTSPEPSPSVSPPAVLAPDRRRS